MSRIAILIAILMRSTRQALAVVIVPSCRAAASKLPGGQEEHTKQAARTQRTHKTHNQTKTFMLSKSEPLNQKARSRIAAATATGLQIR